LIDEIKSRIRSDDLLAKVLDPEDVVRRIIPRKGSIAFAGMANTSYPKVIPRALARYVEESGERFDLIVFSAGTCGIDHEESLAKIGIRRRYPFGAAAEITRKLVNMRSYEVADMWLYEYASWLRRGVFSRRFGKIDVAVIEITGFHNEDAVLGLSVDAAPALVNSAEKVIVELSVVKPYLYGLHDIYEVKPGDIINIRGVLDRVGESVLKIPKSKLAAIVVSDLEDQRGHYTPGGEIDRKVVENILDFLSQETTRDPNLKSEYFTLQPAAGPIASMLADKITELDVDFRIWGEVTSVRWVKHLGDKVKGASAAVIYTLPGEEKFREYLYENINEIKKHVVLRSYEVTNNPQIISRFIHVVIQQAIEVDIYGHVNVSHIERMVYGGVGGSGDHVRPSYLTIIALPSITSKGFPRIVPIVSHVDIVEHDVDVIVTDQGWADLRGLSPVERAKIIIERCAHPSYKDLLWEYFEEVITRREGHQPVDFVRAHEFLKSFSRRGS
jgi:acyl-CoA hydrolase